jgi:hypothetical protein
MILTQNKIEASNEDYGLSNVRQRGVFLISALFWASTAGLILFLAGYTIVFFHYSLAIAEKLRSIAGLPPHTKGTDWFLLILIFIIILLTVLIFRITIGKLWFNYNRKWKRRLEEVWKDTEGYNTYSKTRHLSDSATKHERQLRTDYLRKLLSTSRWKEKWEGLKATEAESFPTDYEPRTIIKEDYEKVAAAVLSNIESDIAERAIATGLIVGVSRNRFIDVLTIISASLELQLHVLTLLGKKPSLSMWIELFKRTGASLFTNTYLNREDVFWVDYTLKSLAMGIGAVAELAQEAADQLELDDAFDTMSENFSGGSINGLIGAGLNLAQLMLEAGLSIGATGLKQISEIIERSGDEMLQGVLAGGVLYYQGMAVAADVLAMDQRHRDSKEMNRSFKDGIDKVIPEAGKILKSYIGLRRKAIRKKKKMAQEAINKMAQEAININRIIPGM